MDKEVWKNWFSHTGDMQVINVDETEGRIKLYYLSSMADQKVIHERLLPRMKRLDLKTASISQLEQELAIPANQRVTKPETVIERLLQGNIYIHVDQESYGLSIPTEGKTHRNVTAPEIEAIVIGAQIAFVEELDTNLSIIRKYLPTSNLYCEKYVVGVSIPTEVAVLYMNGIAEQENINTMRQRIESLQVDSIVDASVLAQYLSDNGLTVFPLMQQTERPDRVVSGLMQGQLAVIVNGSPFAILGPTSLIQFLHSPDDFYFRWGIGTFVRLLRFVAIILSLLLTPAYVASLTFHYELIPADLLISLAQSRSRVPFPPLIEALLLEGVIELLREAGARLPTKVGQTIGIVGGIVIGQAIVQAGFTSNILIIIVALGALSSFIAPSYMLGATVRVIRFPMILLSGMWGGIGIAVGFSFLITHLLRQKSLGRPYLSPFFPLRISDLKDSAVRLPIKYFSRLPVFYSRDPKRRFSPNEADKIDDIDD
ncbi:spore germination protein [Brevibacillus migulae]|uniref:spore germination protein n=1 Tax=Brevibacillus migulae TaxID=1644114 RepID=UPI00106F076C|nr:spore germination protein [Brevibacillus migulae]